MRNIDDEDISFKREKYEVTVISPADQCFRGEIKRKKKHNVSSSPFHLSHPFSNALLLSAFNATSTPRIRIRVFRRPNRRDYFSAEYCSAEYFSAKHVFLGRIFLSRILLSKIFQWDVSRIRIRVFRRPNRRD